MKREYPERPLVGVGAVVLRNDAVLLVQRGSPPGVGRWAIPGGLVNLGETTREATEREVMEECGIKIKAGKVAGVFDAVRLDDEGRVRYHYVLIDHVADYLSGEPVAQDDAADARWVPLDELDSLAILEITKELVRKVAAGDLP
jgi:ADP-ribose pyrophosphatase